MTAERDLSEARDADHPLVSVITIFLDEERFIAEAIESVLAQTFTNWELILVDDGSTDSSPRIAAHYAAEHPGRIRLVGRPGGANRGMSASRNLGLAVARGEFIAFLDADDTYLPEKLDAQLRQLSENPTAAMVYGPTLHWHSWTGRAEDQRDVPRRLGVAPETLVPPPRLVPLYLRGEAQTPGMCGLLVRRSAAQAVGGFDARFRGMYEDQVFILKICLRWPVFVGAVGWDRYRQHPTSHTRVARLSGRWSPGAVSPAEVNFLAWLGEHLDRSDHAGRSVASTDDMAEVRATLTERLRRYPSAMHRPRPLPPPVAAGDRPLWSVMIPTFRRADLLQHTLDSVLAQDQGRSAMQIQVVDDSTPGHDIHAVVHRAAGRVALHVQPCNVGHTRNFNTCLALARGELVHILHGDDLVRPGFYERMAAIFDAHPEIVAAFCRYEVIDHNGRSLHLSPLEREQSGVLPDWFRTIATGQRLQTPAMVVRRSAYEAVGGFDERIETYGEDWEMWTRIASHGPVWYETSPLACYRVHTDSLSGASMRTGRNMRDIRMVIDMNRELMSPSDVEPLTNAARENNALGALRRALRLYDSGDPAAASAQFREALRTSRSPAVVRSTAETMARVGWRMTATMSRRVSLLVSERRSRSGSR